MSSDSPPSNGGFIEKTLFLPRRLWDKIEARCEAEDREPSEVVAEALRLLLAGGIPTASAAVRGPVTENEAAPEQPAALLTLDPYDVATLLQELTGEDPSSPRLAERIEQIAATIEQRDQFRGAHASKVATLADDMATAIGLGDDDRRWIRFGALLHDIGKSQIPESILGKQGRLTPEEWALVKRYPELGAEMLSCLPALSDVVAVVRHHQERWDGSGYPDGLTGEDIPLGAQVVGICDVYHVLTSDRAYRPGLSPETARRTIESGIGRLWNPDLAEILLRKVLA